MNGLEKATARTVAVLEELEFLAEMGVGLTEACGQLEITPNAAERLLYRYGLRALFGKLKRLDPIRIEPLPERAELTQVRIPPAWLSAVTDSTPEWVRAAHDNLLDLEARRVGAYVYTM